MDVLEIQKLLPHRYPFLLVDRVVSIEAGKSLKAYKNVSVNEPFFNGHFPGHPVMPGVLVLEALAQASAMLAYRSTGVRPGHEGHLSDGHRRGEVPPAHRARATGWTSRWRCCASRAPILKTRGEAKVDGQVVAEGEFLATVVDKARAGEKA